MCVTQVCTPNRHTETNASVNTHTHNQFAEFDHQATQTPATERAPARKCRCTGAQTVPARFRERALHECVGCLLFVFCVRVASSRPGKACVATASYRNYLIDWRRAPSDVSSVLCVRSATEWSSGSERVSCASSDSVAGVCVFEGLSLFTQKLHSEATAACRRCGMERLRKLVVRSR